MTRRTRRFALYLAVAASMLIFQGVSSAQGTEENFIRIAATKTQAVLSIVDVGTGTGDSRIVGTGFLLNGDGYFLTAAHVLAKIPKGGVNIDAATHRLIYNVDFPATPESAFNLSSDFQLIDKDEVRDIALCQISSFKDVIKVMKSAPVPFPMFRVATKLPPVGSFVSVIGFPLGTYVPTVQFGTLAAHYNGVMAPPSTPSQPNGHLIQVAISGNKGNSGSPVIEVKTGDCIGIIVLAIPAPLWIDNNAPLQSSGLMLAVPVQWIKEMLDKHNIVSGPIGNAGDRALKKGKLPAKKP